MKYPIGTKVEKLPSKFHECEWDHCVGVITEVAATDSCVAFGGTEVWITNSLLVSLADKAYAAELKGL